MGSELQQVVDAGPCGGYCRPEAPVCKPLRVENRSVPHPDCVDGLTKSGCPGHDNGYSCSEPTCEDAAPYCALGAAIGLRARQICPLTCGCAQPRGPLALSLPENGCPVNCLSTTNYRTALAEMPCEDVARNDTNFLAFLDQWQANCELWPKDWSGSLAIQSVLRHVQSSSLLARRLSSRHLTHDLSCSSLTPPLGFAA